AIFCPEEFEDADKQAECAGRTQIRSGWRPGASGEDFTEAARLLQRERREAGGVAAAPGLPINVRGRFDPAGAQRDDDIRRAGELTDRRRSADSVNNLAQESDNLTDTLVRPDVGPAPFEPSWTKRDDSELTQEEIEELQRQLDDAARQRGDPQ
ncbi:MAG: hypothetical protein AAFY22_01810, partial [Pseudomonadota bacterium]